MPDNAGTAVDVVGTERTELKFASAPLRRERPPALDQMTPEAIYQQLERLQRAIDDATIAARTCALLASGSHLSEEVSFTSGTEVAVKHALGRPYQGWFVVSPKVAAPAIYEVANSSNTILKGELDKVQITLHPTATFKARVYVF